MFAAFGLLIAVGVGLLWWATSNQVGEPPTPASARHTAETAPDRSIPSPGSDAAPSTDTPVRTTSPPGAADTSGESAAPGASPDALEALPASAPVRVSIPSIDVESPLHPLGLADDGTLEVPSGERYDEAAWYSGSPTPGEAGPSVIEGHVTSQGSVPSVFFELGALEAGDLVEVEREDGTSVTFEVYGAQSFPKDAFPKTTVYGNTEGPELRLITCGGTYDPQRRAHLDNIVVFAKMVP